MIQQTSVKTPCPNCLTGQLQGFAQLGKSPAHSVLLLDSRQAALDYPQGQIELGFCARCSFIGNTVFEPSLHEYSAAYEATQAYSETFNAFHRGLAERLVRQHDLHGKRIIEIGCGQGEFLELLGQLGNNQCLGFDPAYRGEAEAEPASSQVAVVPDFYGQQYAQHQADFVCCKMTLEHLHEPARFARSLQASLQHQPEAVLFIQVPNATRVLRETAFWDVYYEHCCYFTAPSLIQLFAEAGFRVLRVETDYNGQYLMLEADGRVGEMPAGVAPWPSGDEVSRLVDAFSDALVSQVAEWHARLAELRRHNRRVVLWGGGSKAVAFLNTLGVCEQIPYAVDINPRKHGCYLAGTGQEVVAPERLQAYRPDVVIVMNAIYTGEIERDLERLGVKAELWPLR